MFIVWNVKNLMGWTKLKYFRALTIATLAIIVLFVLTIPLSGMAAENELPKEVKVEPIDGQYFIDGKPLHFIPYIPAEIPIKITDLDRFIEPVEPDDRDPDTPQLVRVYYSVIEPLLIRIRTPISGTIPPSYEEEWDYADLYGPYPSAIAICVSVSWTPADQVLDVIIYDNATGVGYGYRLTGGSGSTGCPSTAGWAEPAVLIVNPSPPNTEAITYSGTITRYYD